MFLEASGRAGQRDLRGRRAGLRSKRGCQRVAAGVLDGRFAVTEMPAPRALRGLPRRGRPLLVAARDDPPRDARPAVLSETRLRATRCSGRSCSNATSTCSRRGAPRPSRAPSASPRRPAPRAGPIRLRGHSLRASTTLISAAYSVTCAPRCSHTSSAITSANCESVALACRYDVVDVEAADDLEDLPEHGRERDPDPQAARRDRRSR